ncbi:MAG: hypothetical protein ACK4GE_05730, partial [Caldimicrobium sp.]
MSLVLFVVMALNFTLISSLYGAPWELFQKVAELQESSKQARRAALYPDGKVVYYWERTRPPTPQEKEKRAAWFDAEWEKFRRKAEQEGIPEIEKSTKEIEKMLKEEMAKQPLVVRGLTPFFSGVLRGLPAWLRWILEYSRPIARQHLINQPVVVEAGVSIWNPNGKTMVLLPVDVATLYGEESWARFPIDEVHLRVSPDGRYIAIETVEEAIVLFELSSSGLFPKARISGFSPFGWSPDGQYIFMTRKLEGKKVIAILTTEDLQEVAQ